MEAVRSPQDAEPWKRAMVERLAKGNFPDRIADDLMKELADLDVLRSVPVRPFPFGQFGPDGVTLKVVAGKGEIHELLEKIIDSPRLEGIRVFPKGIIEPDFFVGEFDFR